MNFCSIDQQKWDLKPIDILLKYEKLNIKRESSSKINFIWILYLNSNHSHITNLFFEKEKIHVVKKSR